MRVADPLQLLITNLDYDDFKGRLVIGRVTAGHLMVGEQVAISKPGKLSRLEPSSASMSTTGSDDDSSGTSVPQWLHRFCL